MTTFLQQKPAFCFYISILLKLNVNEHSISVPELKSAIIQPPQPIKSQQYYPEHMVSLSEVFNRTINITEQPSSEPLQI